MLPNLLDRGLEGDVKLGQLNIPSNDSMLFYKPAIEAAYPDYEANQGDRVVNMLTKLNAHCQKRQITLLIVLIPDKYQFYLGSISHLTNDLDGYSKRTPPERRSPEVIAEQLKENHVHVIDLFPPLRAFQGKQYPFMSYYHDDTHWNDAGIEEAAVVTYRYLRELMKADRS